MIDALTYLYEILFEFWSYLISTLMVGSGFSDPGSGMNNIIDGDLIRINLIWEDLPAFFTVLTIILLIYLFVKFIVKLLGIFAWK